MVLMQKCLHIHRKEVEDIVTTQKHTITIIGNPFFCPCNCMPTSSHLILVHAYSASQPKPFSFVGVPPQGRRAPPASARTTATAAARLLQWPVGNASSFSRRAHVRFFHFLSSSCISWRCPPVSWKPISCSSSRSPSVIAAHCPAGTILNLHAAALMRIGWVFFARGDQCGESGFRIWG